MRRSFVCWTATLLVPLTAAAQAPGRFPPESLVNAQVFPRTTPVIQVVGVMRNITGALGVRCQYCHVGEEGMPLERFDFASDQKRTKLVARQMLRMVQEINRRLDTIPDRTAPALEVTCTTCHRGLTRPVALTDLLTTVATTAGADSAVRAYRALRQQYHGQAAYDFGEESVALVGARLMRARRFDEAFTLLRLNLEFFPQSAGTHAIVGEVHLARGDTTAAVAAYQSAVRLDPNQFQARQRLRQLGRP